MIRNVGKEVYEVQLEERTSRWEMVGLTVGFIAFIGFVLFIMAVFGTTDQMTALPI